MSNPNEPYNLLGKKKGHIEIISYLGRNRFNQHTWRYQCSCGNIGKITTCAFGAIKNPKCKECGIAQMKGTTHKKLTEEDIAAMEPDYYKKKVLNAREWFQRRRQVEAPPVSDHMYELFKILFTDAY